MKMNKPAQDTRIIVVVVTWIFVIFMLYVFIKPWLAEYNYRNGFMLQGRGSIEESIYYIDKTNKYAPWETYYLLTQIKNYQEMVNKTNDLNKKREWLKKSEDLYLYMLKINPTNAWYSNGLASLYLNMANFSNTSEERKSYIDNAGKFFEKSVEIDSINPLFLSSLAQYYLYRSDKQEEAVYYFKKCIEYDDWFVEAYYRLAELEMRKGNLDAAIPYLEAMASADEKNYDSNSNSYAHWVKGGDFNGFREKLGDIYFSKGDYVKSAENYQWSLKKNPNNASVLEKLGVSYHRQGQTLMAINKYKEAMTIDPTKPDLYRYIAYLYYDMGLLKSSQEYFLKYFRFGVNDKKAQSDYAKVRQLYQNSLR